MSVGEILDAGIKTYRSRFKDLALCVLVTTAPVTILGTLIIASTTENAFTGEPVAGDDQGAFLAGQLIATVLGIIATLVAVAACFRIVQGAVNGEHVRWQESLGFGLRRLLPLFWLIFLTMVLLIPAFLALIIPGIWLAVAFSVALPVLLVEGVGGFAALKRSFRLVRGRWWATFGAILVATLLVMVVISVLMAPVIALLITDSANEVLAAVINALFEIVGNALTLPFQAAVIAIIYFELRSRKEGYDLQMAGDGTPQEAHPPEAGPTFSPPAPAGSQFAPPQAPQPPSQPPPGPQHP